MDHEILTIHEFTALLKNREKTTYTMAQGDELHGFKVRDQWRFRRADIDAWIDKLMYPESPDGERDE